MRRHHHPTECDWLSLRALERRDQGWEGKCGQGHSRRPRNHRDGGW